MKEGFAVDQRVGIYSDLSTRNLVLQSMNVQEGVKLSRKQITLALTDEEIERTINVSVEKGKIPPEFKFTKEYYERIKDEKDRIRAYKELTVSTQILDGIDVEIEADPWKFLYLPKNSNTGHVRAANFRLSKIWHPDRMDPRDPEKLETVFRYSPLDFPIKNSSYQQWLNELRDFAPKSEKEDWERMDLLEPRSPEDLAQMSSEEKSKYLTLHAKQQELETKAEAIRRKMVTMATERMITINKAVAAANKKLGVQTTTSFYNQLYG